MAQTDRVALLALYNATGGPAWTRNDNWDTTSPISQWHGVTVIDDRVVKLGLMSNNLQGHIPPQLRDLSALEELDLSVNELDGSIPPELGALNNLRTLELSNNSLTRPIPMEVRDLAMLEQLRLSENNLTGHIPPQLGYLNALRDLNLSSNKLDGSIPPELGALNNLRTLELSNNSLTGPIPKELGDLAQLKVLRLFGNNLAGHIPRQLGYLSALEEQDLSFNKLDGPIPKELGDLAQLNVLWLSNNNLTGHIPPQLGYLNALRDLNLSSNKLDGSTPPELGALNNLRTLELSINSLTGPIPKELGDLTELKELRMLCNNLTGHIPPQLGYLSVLWELDLSFNKLDGSIPPELGALNNLRTLELSNNSLTRPIPKELGDLAKLKDLQLSNNNLAGHIPPQLRYLTALRKLELSDNKLDVSIPAGVRKIGALASSDVGLIARQGSVERSKDDWTGPPSVVRGRQPYRRPYIGKGWINTRVDSGSCHGSNRGSSRGSSAGSAGNTHGRHDFSAARSSRSVDDLRSMDRTPQATAAQEPDGRRMRGAMGEGAAKKVTIVENLERKDTPCVKQGGGVRVSVPRNALRSCGIGPITVEEAAKVVKRSDDSVYVVLQAVHCRPAGTTFLEPLTLDFAVRDGRVRLWDRAAVREEVLLEYQILSKQSEDDPWQDMDLQDVSVVWDDQGSTCLRARIRHFTWFCVARRTTSANSGMVVSRHWDKRSVLVVNATNSVAHVTPMPISFNTSQEATKACSLTFCDAGIGFEVGRRTEQIVLPVNTSSELIPAGDSAVLFLSGGAREMKIIVCFLPDRSKAEVPSSNQTVSPSSGTSPVIRTTSSRVIQTTATGTQQGAPTNPQASTAAAPSSGGSPPLGAGPLMRATSPTLEEAPQSGGQGASPRESEEMVYSMTKVLPRRQRLTLLQVSVNRKINIEQNARALETYAMMLADFGTAPP